MSSKKGGDKLSQEIWAEKYGTSTNFYNWNLPTSLEYSNKPQDLSTWLLHTNKYVRNIPWHPQSSNTLSQRYASVKEKDWEDML